jgi:hypothetical protein
MVVLAPTRAFVFVFGIDMPTTAPRERIVVKKQDSGMPLAVHCMYFVKISSSKVSHIVFIK